MTCSMLSAIIASTDVTNSARKPAWRSAAKDCFAGVDAAAACAMSFTSRSSLSRTPLPARHPHHPEYRHDLLAAARLCSQRKRAGALEPREVVMGRGGLGRPLVGGAGYAEPRREPVQLVDVIRQQVAPFEPLPFPGRLVDVNGHGAIGSVRYGSPQMPTRVIKRLQSNSAL